ncbi:MAG: glycosyltransferase family 25 protein [Cyclobacteriaceae bacterium]
MKILVINLERDERRKSDMQRQLDDLELEAEFVTGFNGKQASTDRINEICDPDQLTSTFKRPFDQLKGLVGCTYSHYLCYQKMVDEGLSVCCILEDDVILSKHLPEVLDYAEQNIKDKEVISLHTLLYFDTNLTDSDRSNGQDFGILRASPPSIRGTQGYIITKEVARTLKKAMFPIADLPDCWHKYHLNTGIQINVIFPFPLRHMWIDSVRDDERSGMLTQLINFIQKKKIYGFWNVIKWRRRKINDQKIMSHLKVHGKQVKSLYLSDLKNTPFSRY